MVKNLLSTDTNKKQTKRRLKYYDKKEHSIIMGYFNDKKVSREALEKLLDFENLTKVFDHNYIYETDRIIVKQRRFTEEEIETTLEKYTEQLAKIFSKDADFGEGGICLNNRGKVLELLNLMVDDDYEKYDNTATAIEEAIMYEQWQIEGFRNHVIWKDKDKKMPRYFNSQAKIETIFI